MRTTAATRTALVHAALAEARRQLLARDDAIVRAQSQLSEIAAPTGEEDARAARVAERLRAIGVGDVRTDAAGNVVAVRRGSTRAAPVVVCAHLDTVFPRETSLRVRRDGPRLLGPGIGDNGRGLAVMLALAELLDGRRVRTRRDVIFAATTGEEGAGDLRGARHLFATLEAAPDAAIALDGAGDERIVSRALGSRRFRIAYQGPGGHSWAAFGVPNAVHAAARAAARLAELSLPTDPRTTLSVCRIAGGTSINAIPAGAWLEVDLRSTEQSVIERLDQTIRRAAHEAARGERAGPDASGLAVAVTVIGDRPGGAVPDDHALVVSAHAATRLVGRTPQLAVASTDANVPIALGIPAIAIGAGGRGGATHTLHEWYDNTDGPLGVARALTIVATAADLC